MCVGPKPAVQVPQVSDERAPLRRGALTGVPRLWVPPRVSLCVPPRTGSAVPSAGRNECAAGGRLWRPFVCLFVCLFCVCVFLVCFPHRRAKAQVRPLALRTVLRALSAGYSEYSLGYSEYSQVRIPDGTHHLHYAIDRAMPQRMERVRLLMAVSPPGSTPGSTRCEYSKFPCEYSEYPV